jgi:8-oxo-dGTP diphosphatase
MSFAMTDTPPPRDQQRQRIGIAVVERADHYLVGIRGEQAHLAGKAEFPGGKCQPGESAAECAIRECLEETGLRVSIERPLCELEFDYPHVQVHLSFLLCTLIDANAAVRTGWKWIPVQQLPDLDFPEANRTVIQMLTDRQRTRGARI